MKKNVFNFKINIFVILFSFFVGLFLALSFNYLRYNSYYLYPKINDIDPKTAYENIKRNPEMYVIVDVRSESEFRLAHASSSVNLPIHYFYDDTHGLKNEKGINLPKNKDKEIYLMCTGGRLAGVAYSYLEHYGYRNIKRVEGGLSNWNSSGMPVIINNFSYESKDSLDRPYVK